MLVRINSTIVKTTQTGLVRSAKRLQPPKAHIFYRYVCFITGAALQASVSVGHSGVVQPCQPEKGVYTIYFLS